MALSKDDEAYRKNHREQQKNGATPDAPPHRGLHTSPIIQLLLMYLLQPHC